MREAIQMLQPRVAVVGATGDIGSAVCRWLTQRTGIKELLMVARQQQPLTDLREELGGGRILSLDEALPEADVVVWVASMPRVPVASRRYEPYWLDRLLLPSLCLYRSGAHRGAPPAVLY